MYTSGQIGGLQKISSLTQLPTNTEVSISSLDVWRGDSGPQYTKGRSQFVLKLCLPSSLMFYIVPLQIAIGWWWNHFALVALTNVLLGLSVGAICNRRCLLFDSIYCSCAGHESDRSISQIKALLQQKKGPWWANSFIWARVYFELLHRLPQIGLLFSPPACTRQPYLGF